MPRLETLEVRAAPGEDESLVVALRAVLAWQGRAASYDELAAVLGVSPMFAAARAEPCPRRWKAYGRDAFLVAGARQFGLDVRDLHPPDAAPLPTAPPEFEAHFRDSYLPLIEAELAHDHPLLAWMGWPPPCADDWGVITGRDVRRRVCLGRVAGRVGAVRLEAAAVQVYAVQGCPGPAAVPVERAASAVERARIALRGEWPPAFGIETGAAAIEAWRERLDVSEFCPRCAPHDAGCCEALVRVLVSGRRSAARFFREHGRADLANALWAAAECIAPGGETPPWPDRAWHRPEFRKELAARLERAARCESQAAALSDRAGP